MDLVRYEVSDRVATITLDRPDKRNALSGEMVTELKSAFGRASDDEQVKVVVLAAEGDAFCAGADLAYLQQLQSNTYEENLADSSHLMELFKMIYEHKHVVIARIQGHAIAGGCGLATVCDFSFTIPEAKFGYTEVRIGFVPAIVKVFLLRKIGEGKAKQLLLSGELIDASEAQAMGLVNWVVPANELEDKVAAFAQKLVTKNSGQSMSLTKAMIAEVQSMNVEDGLQYAAEQNAGARGTEDCQKGIASFLNKEKPQW